MGSDNMADALIWMVYSDVSGTNITLSPRLGHGHYEPAYSSNISVQVLPGTSITSEGNYTVFAMCSNCRSWKGGSIDPANKQAPFIFATGPDGNLKTNSKSAGIKRHAEYGTFTMDLTLAVGSAGAPIIATADSSGTVQTSDNDDSDWSAALHAAVMILTFVGLMPLGLLILRVLNSPKWHGINQAFSAIVALIGAALGIYAGTMYQRVSLSHQTCIAKYLPFLDDVLQLSTSNNRHHCCSCYDRTICSWLFAPSNIQANTISNKVCPNPRLAWKNCYSSRYCERLHRLPTGNEC